MPASSSASASVRRHVLAALVTNEPGVLAQVAGMFAARGFNIDSLVVGRTDNPELSRMTIVVPGDDAVLEQVRKQLQKLVPVVKVVDYHEVPYVERDLVLVTVATGKPREDGQEDGRGATEYREEIASLATLFRAKVVDVAADRLMIELAGEESKLENFIELLKPYGILELARTGVIAMPRGMAPKARVAEEKKTVDAADLPPG
ncbi:acetolactate synthase small subunit [Phycisphaera mikurensis]|uniref:acetolactate synthase n=1 Tax=Phycisphaera mikurensis (strain NBRC 102666 / KCTC 22515 / FYK2301M01) TaxID=1142394 RepID=I0IGR1_PHYMF|nr:acetolactate synthase small subunit [Phycisphaera mikurensis]MBB6443238.1 acetolactate synthase-1/3 small subunit [Phycisphaera mikurensis]BAM04449.1 acetolactate synthase small subunit [Phycisphaera mikurensis NBRC 102666]